MKKRYWWHLILLLYVIFIYSNSMKPAAVSSKESGGVMTFVQMFLWRIGVPAAGITEHLIRKMAHFAEYTLLGLLLYRNGILCPWKPEVRRLAAVILGFFIPFVDETIQLFVTGRSGQISDVWLDMSGILFGLITAGMIVFARIKAAEKRRRKHEKL